LAHQVNQELEVDDRHKVAEGGYNACEIEHLDEHRGVFVIQTILLEVTTGVLILLFRDDDVRCDIRISLASIVDVDERVDGDAPECVSHASQERDLAEPIQSASEER